MKDGFTIVSGLAAGVDKMAHQTAIEEGGRTIAVIGTPLSHSYPKENSALQHSPPSHISKMVLSTVHVGGLTTTSTAVC